MNTTAHLPHLACRPTNQKRRLHKRSITFGLKTCPYGIYGTAAKPFGVPACKGVTASITRAYAPTCAKSHASNHASSQKFLHAFKPWNLPHLMSGQNNGIKNNGK